MPDLPSPLSLPPSKTVWISAAGSETLGVVCGPCNELAGDELEKRILAKVIWSIKGGACGGPPARSWHQGRKRRVLWSRLPDDFFHRYRVLSYAMARLKSDNLAYRDVPSRWWRSDMLRSEAELRAELMPGGRHYEYVQPDGAWTRHTEMEIAKRDGDHEKLERLEAEQERVMGGVAERIQAALAKTE